MNTSVSPKTSGLRKAAIFVTFLGEEAAAPVLRNLPNTDLQRIAAEIANLPRVPPETTLQVIEEYNQIVTACEYVAAGGHEFAVRMLSKVIGESGARAMVQRLSYEEEHDISCRVDALKNAEPQQLARFLNGEHSQTKALILGHLEPKQASLLLMALEPEARTDCVRRMATIGKFSPEAATKVSQVLSRRFGSANDHNKRVDSGVKNLADVMNRLESTTSREILQDIESEDPNLAISIRNLMFTFENFLEVPEKDLRELMNSIDKKTLALALKGTSEDLRNRIFRTMSTRAVEMIKEDTEMMGPVRSKDVSKAQSEIVAVARALEAEGKIVLKSEGDDEYL